MMVILYDSELVLEDGSDLEDSSDNAVSAVSDTAIVAGSSDSEVFSDDCVYECTFNGDTYYIFFPDSCSDDLAIYNGILVNVGTDNITGCILDDDLSSVSGDTVVVLYPIASSSGSSSYVRYGSYSYLRVYSYSSSSGYNNVSYSDSYGDFTVVSSPSLFSSVPYAAYIFFGLFAALGLWLLKRVYSKGGSFKR